MKSFRTLQIFQAAQATTSMKQGPVNILLASKIRLKIGSNNDLQKSTQKTNDLWFLGDVTCKEHTHRQILIVTACGSSNLGCLAGHEQVTK